jgi:type 1 glutamine amidotransferase
MRLRRLLICVTSISAVFTVSAMAEAHAMLDCPLRDEPLSIDSPLIDVLLKPEAKALLQTDMPTLARLPPMMVSTIPPTFTAIMTPRLAAAFTHASEDDLSALTSDLATLSITDKDREARCARYDNERPTLSVPEGHPRLLVFEKINGYRDAPSVEAADATLRDMAKRNGWALVATDRGGAIARSILKKFDAVIWNNVSGDVLTLTQRRALERYVEQGGGFVAFHGSGGDPVYFWDWYVDTLIGARFLGHPQGPQFQEAHIIVADDPASIAHELAPGWVMTDEWYSFKVSPRLSGAHVIATLDEATYSPKGIGNQDLRMGDHPIAWTKCVRKGRSFYSAIGHRPETYSEAHNVVLLEHAILWAAGASDRSCPQG